jgi:hypothetical protein
MSEETHVASDDKSYKGDRVVNLLENRHLWLIYVVIMGIPGREKVIKSLFERLFLVQDGSIAIATFFAIANAA